MQSLIIQSAVMRYGHIFSSYFTFKFYSFRKDKYFDSLWAIVKLFDFIFKKSSDLYQNLHFYFIEMQYKWITKKQTCLTFQFTVSILNQKSIRAFLLPLSLHPSIFLILFLQTHCLYQVYWQMILGKECFLVSVQVRPQC